MTTNAPPEIESSGTTAVQTREDPYEWIAPRDDHIGTIDMLSEMMLGEMTAGTWLGYHDLRLLKRGGAGTSSVWEVYTADDARQPSEVINCDAFRTATELEDFLSKI